MKVEYETTHALSSGNMIFDLRWPRSDERYDVEL